MTVLHAASELSAVRFSRSIRRVCVLERKRRANSPSSYAGQPEADSLARRA